MVERKLKSHLSLLNLQKSYSIKYSLEMIGNVESNAFSKMSLKISTDEPVTSFNRFSNENALEFSKSG